MDKFPEAFRRLIAVDERCANVNGEQNWVYSALDVDGNVLINMMLGIIFIAFHFHQNHKT